MKLKIIIASVIIDVAIMAALVCAALIIRDNVTLYHGNGQLVGMTWGTSGGCEIDYHPWQAGCWTGDRN